MEWFAHPDARLSRLLLQRGLAALYLLAFVAAARQFRPLAGERGLTPAPLHRVEAAANHVTQLIVPFALFAPQPVATGAAGPPARR